MEKTTDDAPACNAVRSTAGRDDTDIAGRPPRRASILKRSGALEIALLLWHAANRMDASLIEELITKDKPFKVETASGRVFEVPHRDFCELFDEEDVADYFLRGERHRTLRYCAASHHHSCDGAGLG
ncbi:MAG: hypothetical protein DME33_04395 [Verrucomicrobia bacterium]|nr:MAG: hypothetical protein DME33_04395 [Verrucomicrobiota bacterium]